jgi:uncharacterized protein (TIGR02145 family)
MMNTIKSFLILIISAALIAVPTGCKKANEVIVEKGTVSDFEGNVYPTIKIGTQWWMAKNLKATKYNNGDQIGTTTPNSLSIVGAVSPKYHWAYMGNESFAAIYGRLYTWYAVTDSRNVCPAGWHVPSNAEWSILSDYLSANGYGYQGSSTGIAKSMASTSGWLLYGIVGYPGTEQSLNDKSGFGAMPGGIRLPEGTYRNAGAGAYYWSSTADIPSMASYRELYFDIMTLLEGNYTKDSGLSVRCLKD